MNRLEYLLSKLAEECAEVTQRATKIQTFGLDETQPGQELTNRARLGFELRDLLVIVYELEELIGHLPGVRDYEGCEAKRAELHKYMQYSREQNCLQD